jgi:ribonuclease E
VGEGYPADEGAHDEELNGPGNFVDEFNRREEPELPADDENRGNLALPEPRADENAGTSSERLEAIFDNEDADAAAENAAPVAEPGPVDGEEAAEAVEEGDAPKKRRRRRGGRRHRRRGEGAAGDTVAEGVEGEPTEEEAATPLAEAETPEPVAEVIEEVIEEAPAKTSRRRRPAAAKPRKTARPSRKAPAAAPAAAAVEATPEAVVVPNVRSGSTDRHLVLDDVPVDPEPVRRPRSARDLDEVPDDFD